MTRGQSPACLPGRGFASVEWDYWGFFQAAWDGRGLAVIAALTLVADPGGRSAVNGAVYLFRVMSPGKMSSWSSGVSTAAWLRRLDGEQLQKEFDALSPAASRRNCLRERIVSSTSELRL